MDYICSPFTRKFWEFSSAGLEHLPYKQRVTGSNPVTPTNRNRPFERKAFFVFINLQ